MMMTNLLHGRSSQGGNLLPDGRWAGEGDNAHLVIIMNMIMMIMIMMIMKIIFPMIMIIMIMILMIMILMIKRTICWTCGWVTIASPTVFPKPNTMFTTPVKGYIVIFLTIWCVVFVFKYDISSPRIKYHLRAILMVLPRKITLLRARLIVPYSMGFIYGKLSSMKWPYNECLLAWG